MIEDNSEDEGGSGHTGPQSVASMVYNGLIQRGVKPAVAYGALGSLMGESGSNLTTSSLNRGDGSDGSDSIGFGQWNGSRASALRATAKAMGVPWTSGQAQVSHLFNELGGQYSGVLKALQGASSVADGNDIWTRQYERPANVDQAVAQRLAHGLNLSNAATNGTLDLSKLGYLGPNQGAKMSPGALGMDSMGGSPSLGALFKYIQDNQPQQQEPTFGQRLAMLGASLASISNPGQASTLMNMANTMNRQQAQADPASQLLKAIAIKQGMANLAKADKLPVPEDIGATPDGAARIVRDPNTGSFSVVPVSGAAEHNDNGKSQEAMDKLLVTQAPKIGDTAATLSDAAKLKDEGDRLRYELATNPEIYQKLGWGQNMISWLKNAEGKSDAASQFIKDFNAYFKGAATTAASNAHIGKVTNMEMQAFQDRFAPNGAPYDPITLMQALNRMTDSAQGVFNGATTKANTYDQQFGGKVPWQFQDSGGEDTSYKDFRDSHLKSWQDNSKKIQDAYDNQLLPWHNAKTGKASSAPKSFLDFGLGNK